MTPQIELPVYQCFKQVYALKILKLTEGESRNNSHPVVTMTFYDERYAPISLSKIIIDKHKPKSGWYYIQYEDGYVSFSPADTFEKGYALITDGTGHSPLQAAYMAQRAAQAIASKESAALVEELNRVRKEKRQTSQENADILAEVNDEMNLRGRLITLLDRTARALRSGQPFDPNAIDLAELNALPEKVYELRVAADGAADLLDKCAAVLLEPPASMTEEQRELFINKGHEIAGVVRGLRDAGRLTPGVINIETQQLTDSAPAGEPAEEECDRDPLCTMSKGHEGDCTPIF